MSTPGKVASWLRNNDGNLTDAYKAVDYNGPPLKIKEGNLSTNRSNIRLAIRGTNGDSSRKHALNLNPPQDKSEQNRNRRQNYKRSSLRKQGKNVVIDHTVELDLLAKTVNGMSSDQAKLHIKKLEESYGPLGDRPDNRRIIGYRQNEIKRQQNGNLQKALADLDSRPSGLQNLIDVGQQALKRGATKIARNAVPYAGTTLDAQDTAQRFDEFKQKPNGTNGAQLAVQGLSTAANFVGDLALSTGVGAPIAAGAEKVAGLMTLTDALLQGVEDLNGRSGRQ